MIRDDDNNRIEYTEAISGSSASETDKTYEWDSQYNKITFAAETVAAYSGNRFEIQYTKKVYNTLARNYGALHLLQNSSVTFDTDTINPKISFIQKRIDSLLKKISPCIAVGSEDMKNWNNTYGDVIKQKRFYTYD